MSKRKLLLADDSVTIQKVVNLTFAEEGIEVITAGDGNTAMKKFVESTPDLVMVDVNMPGLGGYRICEMIKQDEETKQIPVILLVGSFEPFDEAEARRVGADDYLTKPFQSIRQLVNKVSDLLNNSNKGGSFSNQGILTLENQNTKTPENNFNAAYETTSEADFEHFDNSAMDDEMIQTNQIGSLPADEMQRFISEPNVQTSENDSVYSNKAEKEDSPETQAQLTTDFGQSQPTPDEAEILLADEKIYGFADEETNDRTFEPEISTQNTQDNEKFSANTEINNSGTSNSNFNANAVSQDAANFDFDDFDLLELPPLENESVPEVEQKIVAEPSKTAIETNVRDKENLPETANFSPEVIEAIARKVIEKLSDKVIKEIAREVTPQMAESIISEMTRNKTN